jgi:hypothetical protein
MSRTLRLFLAVGAIVLLLGTGVAMAANPHTGGTPGRPGQTCQLLGNPPPTPGNSANAKGSPFNQNGVSGTEYAGAEANNSGNGQASQYDVACFQQTQH